MCGLFGYFDKKKVLPVSQARSLARGLAIEAEDRGEDAAGFAVYENNKIKVTKNAAPASSLVFEFNPSPILIGHTRFATMGDPASKDQAHPFLSHDGTLALTHNGVGQFDFRRLNKILGNDCETDSQGMLRYFEIYGTGEAGMKSFFADWKFSSFAISLLDLKRESLILFRNEKKPMWLAQTKDAVIIYGSTPEIIYEGCESAKLYVEKIIEIEPGIKYEFSRSNLPTVTKIAA
jgi:glucosamine 6-phosphate synthetase-like amidotransferase/phosphosugar isomerase protein